MAFRMRRIAAARRGEVGVQIVTLPLLAAHVAGGFTRPARSQDLDPAIRSGLVVGGFSELESIRQLPGMTRSIAGTLAKVWQAGLSLADCAEHSARLADVAEVERRVRRHLSAGVLALRDLRDAALRRLAHAPTVLGPVELDGLVSVAPVWRPLLKALGERVAVCWRNPGTTDIDWLQAKLVKDESPAAAGMAMVSCANPRAEVIEALRWSVSSSRRVEPGPKRSPSAPLPRRSGTSISSF